MRKTTIKKGAIDLDSVFSPGFLTDTDGRLITGYKWDHFSPNLNPNSNSETTFQMPRAPHVVDGIVLLYMFVNGVKVEPDYLSLDIQEPTIVIYNDTDYPIVATDTVDIWYVAAANIGGQPIQEPLPQAQAAGSEGHIQINNGSDALTFAPVKWIVNALVPDQDSVYDLGTQDKQWNDLYLSGNTIYLDGVPISIDSQTSDLLVSGSALAKASDVAPATLLQNQDFVDAITGPAGPQGDQGPQGVQGPTGAQGPTGLTGPQGIQGVAGADGQDGAQGPQGLQGDQGPQGLQGPAGPQGPAGSGITFQGSVATINDLPGNASQGDAYIVQSDDSLHVHDGTSFVSGGSIQGPQGQQGIQGPAGPQGIQGIAGADGAQGPAGQDGAQGPQGPAGASVTNLTVTNTTIAATLSDNSTITGSISMDINSLSDVDITNTAHTLSDGYVLTWDSTHNHWHPESPGQVSVGALSVGNTSVDLTDTGSDGTITFNTEGTDRWKFSSSGHLIPNGNATYDIGEAENKVRHFYLSNNSLIFESGSLGVDGDSELSFTPSGGEASKIATKAYVDANAGGGSSYPYTETIFDRTDLQTYPYNPATVFSSPVPYLNRAPFTSPTNTSGLTIQNSSGEMFVDVNDNPATLQNARLSSYKYNSNIDDYYYHFLSGVYEIDYQLILKIDTSVLYNYGIDYYLRNMNATPAYTVPVGRGFFTTTNEIFSGVDVSNGLNFVKTKYLTPSISPSTGALESNRVLMHFSLKGQIETTSNTQIKNDWSYAQTSWGWESTEYFYSKITKIL